MSYSIAHTIPEEDYENYLTEAETINMVKGFNAHLHSLNIQVDELSKLNQSLTQKISKEVSRNESLRSQIDQEKKKISSTDFEISLKSEELQKNEKKILQELKPLPSVSLDSPDFSLSHLINLVDYLERLETSVIILNTQADLLQKKIADKNLEMSSDVKCINCKEKYTPKENFEKACKFHPGKLRYFSCRGCGGDAYFDCCLKCKECLQGCKVTHHTS